MTSTGKLTDEEELKRRGLVVGGLLGEGSYAKVKWANSEEHGQKVALKIISRKRAPADFLQKFMPRELELMKNLDHPHIVKLYEVYDFNDKIVMVMEMAGHGDLLEYIKLRGALPENKARKLFGQLLSAVSHIHSINIIHRDLKCENVLLDVDSNVKLSDFGFARKLTSDQLSKTYCGSAAYAAPEVLQGIPYKGTVYDAWSLGVILYILVCGTMPYDDSDVKKMIKTQTEKKVGFSRRVRIGDDVKNLIHAILEVNVDRRYTLTQMRDHVWMTSAAATVDSKTVTSGGPGSGGGGGTSDKSRSEFPRGRKLPHHKEETQPIGGAEAETGQTAGGGGGKENDNTDQVADLTTRAIPTGAVTGSMDTATAAIDRLSHNNNCAASGHEAAPTPLEKTPKTTVLITAGAIGVRRKAVGGASGIPEKLNSTSSTAFHLTAEMEIEYQDENCQQQTINALS